MLTEQLLKCSCFSARSAVLKDMKGDCMQSDFATLSCMPHDSLRLARIQSLPEVL